MPDPFDNFQRTTTPSSSNTKASHWMCPTCSLMLPTTATVCPQDGTAISTAIENDLGLGGSYELMGAVGTGGMSVIYKARQTALNKVVAIKMLHSHLLTDQSILRFQQEARSSSSLRHPHIIAVHDFGVSKLGQPFMVMDFIEGVTLAELLLDRGPLPLPDAMDIFLQVADALQYAHAHGVVHRDLKPSNIMISPLRDGCDVRIVDFGIAKTMEAGSGIAQQLTRTGDVMGSPLYMSPEQCMSKKLDQRSDIYSYGCLLYEAVVGFPPHRGETSLETIFKHLYEKPMPLHEARPDIVFPQSFERVVQKLLETKPEDRYQSFTDIKQDLINMQSGALQAVEEPKKQEPLEFKISRGFMVVLAGLLLIVVGIVLILRANSTLEDANEAKRRTAQDLRVIEDMKGGAKPNSGDAAVSPARLPNEINTVSSNIDLSGSKFRPDLMPKLNQFARMRSLDLSNTPIADASIDFLTAQKGLMLLQLNDTKLTPFALSKLASMTNLQQLNLDGTVVDDSVLAELATMPNLTNLYLRDTRVTDLGLEKLLKAKKLDVLAVSGTNIDERGLASIAKTNVRKLSLFDTKIPPGGLKVLRWNEHIAHLTISHMRMNSEDFETLSDMDTLNYLELYHIPTLKDDNLKILQQLSVLHTFYTEDCNVTDKAAVYVDGAFELNALGLNGTRITDHFFSHIKHLKKLEQVWLEQTDVGDETAKSLSNLKQLKSIQMLGTKITDKGMLALIDCPHLTTLDLRYCMNVTRRGLAEFRRRKPNCTLYAPFED